MLNTTSHIRKAAVLLRSLDADTATTLLMQLSPEEAAALRSAIRSLGSVDPDEQADVAAEFRRAAPTVVDHGVELQLSGAESHPDDDRDTVRRFEFLEHSPIDAIVRCLAREHVQTIAVVLSYLRPARAAEVLAALPSRLQAESLERLSALGESDPDSVTVVERELAAWLNSQPAAARQRAHRTDTIAAILVAAQQTSRDGILDNLKQHNGRLAGEILQLLPQPDSRQANPLDPPSPPPAPVPHPTVMTPLPPPPPPPPVFDFDDLVRLSSDELAAVLRQVDANVLVLALAGSSDELVDQVTGRMPRKVAKAFRRQLRRMGPTRLRDVEAAQAAVAAVAAQTISSPPHHRRAAA